MNADRAKGWALVTLAGLHLWFSRHSIRAAWRHLNGDFR
jgi:hypothetical protein